MDKNIIFLTMDAKERIFILKLFAWQKLLSLNSLLSFLTFAAENLSNQFKVALEVVTKIVKVLFDLFWLCGLPYFLR